MDIKNLSLFRTLTLLTFFIILMQLSYFFSISLTKGLIHIIVKSAVTVEFLQTKTVLIPLIIYLCTQLLLNIFIICAVWYMAINLGELFKLRYAHTFLLGIFIWFMSIVLIASANSIYFHQSIFALPINSFLILLYQCSLIFFISVILLTLINLFIYKKINANAVYIFIILGSSIWLLGARHKIVPSSATVEKPNIILISIEALRPDFITTANMPFLSALLKNSVQFTDAYTAIAQSFPAWISVLTAKTPLHNGARSLYENYHHINFQNSLLVKLNQAGYETIYAVDGQRFGDITLQTGFNHIISPPYGIAELIIGSLSDFPLSNLIAPTYLGKILFPYSYANRSVTATYYPKNFIDLVANNLHRTNKPIFLGIHFSMSHWPYKWANDLTDEKTLLPEQYQHSLQVADNQIETFFNLLQKEGLLKHALVILMSDHGIGLGLPGDRVINANHYIGDKQKLLIFKPRAYSTEKKSGIDTSYGYSTDILSMKQYHALLAIKTYGIKTLVPHKVDTRSSLMDIAPTVLDILNLSAIPHSDGISLKNDLYNFSTSSKQKRILFFENGFTTPEIAQANISVNDVLKSSIQTVKLDNQSGLLYISDVAKKVMLKNKQRALLADDWLLAQYQASPLTMILVNLKTGEWTMDLHSDFAQQAKIKQLMRLFNDYYAKDIDIKNSP